MSWAKLRVASASFSVRLGEKEFYKDPNIFGDLILPFRDHSSQEAATTQLFENPPPPQKKKKKKKKKNEESIQVDQARTITQSVLCT